MHKEKTGAERCVYTALTSTIGSEKFQKIIWNSSDPIVEVFGTFVQVLCDKVCQ
jgi:hypothetical protein